MSRGLYIDPQPLANDLMYNNDLVGQFPSVMADLAQSMQMIIDDDSMSGNGYGAMKDRLRDYDLPLLNGFRSLALSLPGVYRLQFALLQPVYELGTDTLDENDIDSQISSLQAEIDTCQDNENKYVDPLDLDAIQLHNMVVQEANTTISYDTELIQELQAKETAIESYDSATAGIYSDVGQLIDALKRGISYVQSMAITANGWTSDLDDSWKDDIATCNQTIYKDLDQESLDLTAQNPDLMILSPNGKVIYYNGTAYQVYDPTQDPNFAAGDDPTLEDGWTTTDFEGASASTTDSAMTTWLHSQYPESFDDADDDKEPQNSAEEDMDTAASGLGLFNSWAEASQDGQHDASVGMYFQSNGGQNRVIIVGNSTNTTLGKAYDPETYPYSDGYTTFDSSGTTCTTVNTDNGVQTFSGGSTAVANALQSRGIDAYPDDNVGNDSRGPVLDPPTAK